MAMLRYNALRNPSSRDGVPIATTLFSGKKREIAYPSEADALLFQPVLCFLSVIGSSSIIAYAIFQNAVRSPEVRSEPPFLSLSRGASTLQAGHARSKDPPGSGTLLGATADLRLMWLNLV